MKVLVATTRTQGQRSNDFSWTTDGELVHFGTMRCSSGYTDDFCGCHRAMAGLDSHKSTTTVEVADRPDIGSAGDLAALIAKSLKDGGWGTQEEIAASDAAAIIEAAAGWPTGTVLEYRDDTLSARTAAS